jgi:hypothetical protein
MVYQGVKGEESSSGGLDVARDLVIVTLAVAGATPASVDDGSRGEEERHARPFSALGHSHDLGRLGSSREKGRRGVVGRLFCWAGPIERMRRFLLFFF